MTKIDWVRKLTSRKLWTAVGSFVSLLIVALGYSENTAVQITSLIMAGASVVAYIIGEGLVDSPSLKKLQRMNKRTEARSNPGLLHFWERRILWDIQIAR